MGVSLPSGVIEFACDPAGVALTVVGVVSVMGGVKMISARDTCRPIGARIQEFSACSVCCLKEEW